MSPIIHGDATREAWARATRKKRYWLNDQIAVFRSNRHPAWSDATKRGRFLRRVQVWLRGEWLD